MTINNALYCNYQPVIVSVLPALPITGANHEGYHARAIKLTTNRKSNNNKKGKEQLLGYILQGEALRFLTPLLMEYPSLPHEMIVTKELIRKKGVDATAGIRENATPSPNREGNSPK
jgi:hypothetical protein